MFEEYLSEEEKKNPVAFYFWRAKELEIGAEYMHLVSFKTKFVYDIEVRNNYHILYDRVMSSNISDYCKKEMEDWYTFNYDFVGFMSVQDLNKGLEEMLNRFNLL